MIKFSINKTGIFCFTHGKKAWFRNHVNDQFVKKATQLNYRSRAIFKLEQIQNKFKILGKRVLDLGAAPGSWSEFVKEHHEKHFEKQGKIVAVDLLEMKPIQKVDVYKFDARDSIFQSMIIQKYGKFNSIISDMAPNFSGQAFQTHQQIIDLNKMCLRLCFQLGDTQCNLVMKTLEGQYQKSMFELLELFFQKVSRFKPKSSRSQSYEKFLVCQKLNKQWSQSEVLKKNIVHYLNQLILPKKFNKSEFRHNLKQLKNQ